MKMKKWLASLLAAAMVTGLLAACGGGSSSTANTADTAGDTAAETTADDTAEDAGDADADAGEATGGGGAKTITILSIWAEDTDNGKLLTDLTRQFIEEVNPEFDFEFELVSSDNLTQKISTLVASDDLPDVFVYDSGTPLKDLIAADKVLNITEALTDLGVYDQLDAAAISLLSSLSGTDDIYDLPLGLNVEGFWYNKALFEQVGVDVPETWDDFIAACDAFMDAGIQPLSAGGADKWPLTRLINAYAYRTMGTDIQDRAAEGEIAYTDEGLVAAAEMISDMAAKGYFGTGVTTVDQTTAGDMLLSGQSAMFYNGSWFTENLTADTNPAGEDGIGFMGVPVVDTSVSVATEYPMNCGNILCLSKDKYDDITGEWLAYIVSHLGDYAMEQYGALKGYKYTVEGDLGTYSQMVADALVEATGSTKWWEAAMNNETSSAASSYVQTLVNGDMTAEEYMQAIQEAYEASN